MPPVYSSVRSIACQPIAVGVRKSVIGWCCQKSLTASVSGPSLRTPSWRAPSAISNGSPPAGATRSAPPTAISSPAPAGFEAHDRTLLEREGAELDARVALIAHYLVVAPAPSTISKVTALAA